MKGQRHKHLSAFNQGQEDYSGQLKSNTTTFKSCLIETVGVCLTFEL